ncbi:MAG: DUF4450 domain-containing protein [Bacteroidetes bacterium]|nr:DUF4450 domain-containing protein [Bacteroidota bacterium]
MKIRFLLPIILLLVMISTFCFGQNEPVRNQKYWHNKERVIRYKPDGDDFVIVNGGRRFNRALYGTNTAFRVEAGDLPEFAMYMPGMGGNLKFGLSTTNNSKWLIDASKITARYRPGSMLYEIEDPILGKGKLYITILALSDAEGFVVRTQFRNITKKINFIWAFGGASGQKFSRDGDMNVDPESSFYLMPENCKTNRFEIKDHSFSLHYGGTKTLSEDDRYFADKKTNETNTKSKKLRLIGAVPPQSEIHIADANQLNSPEKLFDSKESTSPVLSGKLQIKSNDPFYFIIQNPETKAILDYGDASSIFDKAEVFRKLYANRITVETPDPYINTLGGAIGIAANAIWEDPTFLHGAIGWRMRLNGWRGPYTGDALGWHDRAKMHFNAYAKSQIISPESGPNIPDPDKNLARQQEVLGNTLYTNGYICRNPDGKLSAHHYDMNLVYIDALLRHFNWTGDTAYIKEMWPILKRHLAWEKRNFDGDNDGLYDAYCCIWASDALQYSGSGVTHSTAYNYLANKSAAYLAKVIGEDPKPYQEESEKILNAINTRLWIPNKGWYAEFQETLGLKRVHTAAALWTVYHTLDSEVADPFKAYQTTRYVDSEIPHIPVIAKGLADDGYYILSTSNWMPYEWSINNVVSAENMHTALAYWQSGRNDDAFKLWKSTLLDAMYLGGSPGNFLQISYYDANRYEAYRDFADQVGMASRSLVEGLFGIIPDLLENTLTIRPGLPVKWDHASLKTPDISFIFKKKGNKERYTIIPTLPKPVRIKFRATAKAESVKSVKVNGKNVSWTNVDAAIEYPQIEINTEIASKFIIDIEWQGIKPELARNTPSFGLHQTLYSSFNKANVIEIFDPQKSLTNIKLNSNSITAQVVGEKGNRTAFAKLRQGQFTWWAPICFKVEEPIDIIAPLAQEKNQLKFIIQNNTANLVSAKVIINPEITTYTKTVIIQPNNHSEEIIIPYENLISGSNLVCVEYDNNKIFEKIVTNWNVDCKKNQYFEKINLTAIFNDKVINIFKNEYLSPRSPYPTLAIPKQGIGNWCSPMMTANIDDAGLRANAGSKNEIITPQGIPFATPSNREEKNIAFTSQWDNYPRSISIPLAGKATHAYLLMAGSTYHMQSQIINGEVIVGYTDGTNSMLDLKNPETWCPIDRDYYVDGYAFSLTIPRPMRLELKTGKFFPDFNLSKSSTDYGGKSIDGGASTILDIPLSPSKQLKSITVKTLSNEVVIGLMSVSLLR